MTAACFAEMGNQVLCIDVDVDKIAALNRGEIPIHEPGLDSMVRSNADAGRLKFSADCSGRRRARRESSSSQSEHLPRTMVRQIYATCSRSRGRLRNT